MTPHTNEELLDLIIEFINSRKVMPGEFGGGYSYAWVELEEFIESLKSNQMKQI